MKLLLQQESFFDRFGWPIQSATMQNDPRMVNELVERRGIHRVTPLHLAARNGNAEIVALLLARGANINVRDASGDTPLRLALKRQHLDVTKLLLDQKANVNVKDAEGYNEVHIAAQRGLDDMIPSLIESGADLNARNRNGDTPLHAALASQNGVDDQQRLKVVKLLVEHKAVSRADHDGCLPLHLAAASGYNQILSLFLDQGHSIDARNYEGYTPLHMAIQSNQVATAKYLLRQGADPNIPSVYGEAPLHRAPSKNNADITRHLFACDCDIYPRRRDGNTPLRTAIECASGELVKYLIEQGADLAAPGRYGITCLGWLRRLRPQLRMLERPGQELDYTTFGSDSTSLRHKASELAALMRRDKQERRKELYCFSKSLLMLGMECDARLAHQLRVLADSWNIPYCNVCRIHQTRDGPFYACKTCPEVDLCGECMTRHEGKPLLNLCRDHGFWRVVASEARIRLDQFEAFDEWLLGIEEQLRPTDSNEYTREHV